MKFIKENQLATDLTASLAKQIIEIEKTVPVTAGNSNFFAAVVNYDAFDIRTVYAISDNGGALRVSLFDSPQADREIYRSLEQSVVNDIAAVPCRDKSGGKCLYIRVSNTTQQDFNVKLLIKLINL
ncbi:MAG: hypothetical protein E6713_07720 [Sporomusaceae bacterium]|nr:hypothetical protein [Sporomusaceae bacterium]